MIYVRNLHISLAAFCGILSFAVSSQNTNEITKNIESSSVKFAYHNSFIHPGLRLGLELPMMRITINKSKKNNKTKTIIKERFLTTQFSWYYHPNFHSNYYLTAGALCRRTKSSGFFMQGSFELGYSRTILAGATYEVTQDGNVDKVPLAGNNYFAFLIGGGLGYDLSQKKGKPLKLYLNSHALFLAPYNSSVYPRPILELGLIYTPKKFLQLNNRIKIKNKS